MAPSMFPRCRLLLVLFFVAVFSGQHCLALPAGNARIGGMSLRRRSNDRLGFGSSSQSGTSSGNLSRTQAGGIRIGGASSVVDSFLNEIKSGEVTSKVASDKKVLGLAFREQKSSPSSLNRRIDIKSSEINGSISDDVVQALLNDDDLVDTILLTNPDDDSRPAKKVQLSDSFTQLDSLLKVLDSNGVSVNNGAHVLEVDSDGSDSGPIFTLKKLTPIETASAQRLFNSDGEEVAVENQYQGYGIGDSSNNTAAMGSALNQSGTTGLSRYTVVGFSTTVDPLFGRSASITTSAVTGKSFGKTSPAAATDTLEDLADRYGTTVEDIVLLNNLPSEDVDITGLILDIPSDLSTIGFACDDSGDCGDTGVEQGDTMSEIAEKFGVSVDWLLEMNGVTDPNFVFDDLTKLQIPGRRPAGADPLPEALPTNTQLEQADYGAYTNFEETYQVEGAAAPLFQNSFRRSFE